MIPMWWTLAWAVFIGLFSFAIGWAMAAGEWPWQSWVHRSGWVRRWKQRR